METNMGLADRAIRFLIATGILVLYLMDIISGTWAIILGVIALVFVLTSFIGYCPLYLPFRIKTKKNK